MSDKLQFLEKIFGSSKFSHSTNEAEFICCFSDCPSLSKSKKKLSINLETDYFKCWVCGKAGRNLYSIIAKKGTREDVRLYSSRFKSRSVSQRIKEEDLKFSLSLPDGYLPLVSLENSITYGRFFSYLESRGVSKLDILRYKIGVGSSGEHANRIIIPSFDANGKLNFFTSRNIGPKSFYSVPELPRGYKNTVVMNELNIDWDFPVTIVEGFFDLVKCNRNTVPLFGSSLHTDSKLFASIVENETPVFLALDPDAQDKSMKIAKSFMRYSIPVYFIDCKPYKDVGEMTREEFLERYNNAILLSEKDILLEKIRSLAN